MTVSRDTTAQQLRRRRIAAHRCFPMGDGRRDPMDRKPTNTRPVEVTIGGRTAWFEPRPIVRAAIRVVRPARWQYDPRVKAIAMPVDHADDVLAWLEHRGVRIELVNAVIAR